MTQFLDKMKTHVQAMDQRKVAVLVGDARFPKAFPDALKSVFVLLQLVLAMGDRTPVSST
jgi:hypothetical protein